MTTHRALILKSFDTPASLETGPRPTADTGSVVVRVLAVPLEPFAREVFNGSRGYNLTFPLAPGPNAIGRVEEVGPDATKLAPGQLVICVPAIHGRDNPNIQILLGLHAGMTSASQKLMSDSWRNGTIAEYVKMPLENVFELDEEILLTPAPKGCGYQISDLGAISSCLIPFGGLDDAAVKPGDTVIVAPGTGKFGGAAVAVALAMGARVIAAGRNAKALDALAKIAGSSGSLKTVQLASDLDKDCVTISEAVGKTGADVYIDFSPPEAGAGGKTPTHFAACLSVLRRGGICCLMGGIFSNVEIPYGLVLFNNLQIRGKFMYERDQTERLLRMVHNKNLKLGREAGIEVVGSFGLEEAKEALDKAAESPRWGSMVVVTP